MTLSLFLSLALSLLVPEVLAMIDFFLPTPGLTVEPSTSGRQKRLTAESEWDSPRTASGSAKVQVCGLLGRPLTTYNEVNGEVGLRGG